MPINLGKAFAPMTHDIERVFVYFVGLFILSLILAYFAGTPFSGKRKKVVRDMIRYIWMSCGLVFFMFHLTLITGA